MKTLKDHVILYDAECPMCRLYTGAFQKSGMLDEKGRQAYQYMPQEMCPLIDRQRATDEIALVNTQTGEVTYGIHSLFTVIGHAFPVCKPLFRCTPFTWAMAKLYAFISYNRRVIIPPSRNEGAHAFQPTFRLGYRLAYLIAGSLLAAFILTRYTPLLSPLLPAGAAWREYAICFGQLLVQGCVVSLLKPAQRWNYLGNLVTVSLAGGLLLLPALIAAHYVQPSPAAATAYFLVVVACMLAEHLRRTKLLHLSILLSCSWVLYRVLVLFFLLK